MELIIGILIGAGGTFLGMLIFEKWKNKNSESNEDLDFVKTLNTMKLLAKKCKLI